MGRRGRAKHERKMVCMKEVTKRNANTEETNKKEKLNEIKKLRKKKIKNEIEKKLENKKAKIRNL